MPGSSSSPKPTLENLIAALDESPLVCYAVDAQLRVEYYNPSWDRFATENGAPQLAKGAAYGTDLHGVFGDRLRPFYLRAFEKMGRSGSIWRCWYDCSSPQIVRKFQMRILPLRPTGTFLITNAPLIDLATLSGPKEGENYVNSHAQITMCGHCRCSRGTDRPDHWDFVQAHFNPQLDNISHGLCPVCPEYFYPKPE